MKFTSKTPRVPVTIQKQVFQLPQPFSVGDVLDENMTRALNQVFCENIRNNQAKAVSDGIAAGKSVEELQADIDAYMADYDFGVRRLGGRGGDPIMIQALSIAKERIKNGMKKKGIVLKTVSTEDLNKLAAEAVEKHPQIMESAKAIVAAQAEAIAGLELED